MKTAPLTTSSSKESRCQCKTCQKFCIGNADQLRHQCHSCRLTQLKSKYVQKKLECYHKFEIREELKALSKKIEKGKLSDIEEYYSDEVSRDENEKDEDFVTSSLAKEMQKTSILLSIYKWDLPLQNVVKQMTTIQI